MNSVLGMVDSHASLDDIMKDLPTAYDNYKNATFDDSIQRTVKNITNSLQNADFGDPATYGKLLPSLYGQAKGLGATIGNLRDMLKQKAIPKDEVERLYQQLEESDPQLKVLYFPPPLNQEFPNLSQQQDLKNVLLANNEQKAALWARIQELNQLLVSIPLQISQNFLHVDELNRKITSFDLYMTDILVSYLDTIRKQSEERLRYWQHCLAQSFEYRLTQPFPAANFLYFVRDRLIKFMVEDGKGMVLSDEDVQSVATVFYGELRQVTASVVNWILSHQESSTTRHLQLNQYVEDLNSLLNTRKPLTIDLSSIVASSEQMQRILGIGASFEVDPSYKPNPLADSLVLQVVHGNEYVIRANGGLYLFQPR